MFLAEPSSVQPHLSLAQQVGGWSNSRSCPVWGLLFRSPASGSVPHPVTSTCQFPVGSQITSHRNCGLWGGSWRSGQDPGGKVNISVPPPTAPIQAFTNPAPIQIHKGKHTRSAHTNIHLPPKNKHYRSHINKKTAICRNTYTQTHTHDDWPTNTDPKNSALTNTASPAQSHTCTLTCTRFRCFKVHFHINVTTHLYK